MIINLTDRTHSEAFAKAQAAAVEATKQQILRNKERRGRLMSTRVRDVTNGKHGFVEAMLRAGSHD